MYKEAARLSLRFPTSKGSITVEDLWKLPLIKADPCLDDLAIDLSRAIERSPGKSFVLEVADVNETLQLKFDIVKDIIDTKLLEQESRKLLTAKAEKKKEILALIAEKQKDALGEQSIEQLTAMLGEL